MVPVKLRKMPTKDDNSPKLHLRFGISDRSSFPNESVLESAARVAMIGFGVDSVLQWQMGHLGIDFSQQAAQNISPHSVDTSNAPAKEVPHPLQDDAF
jgi:hypothetical protein